MKNYRLGFACKFSEVDKSGDVVSVPALNFKTTTLAWLNRQSGTVAEERLFDIVRHNLCAMRELIRKVGSNPSHLKMVRIGSDVLPAYTAPKWRDFYHDVAVRTLLSNELAKIGSIARELDVRLSMHPGQYCCLASENSNVVNNSIEEFEYHVDVARWMGYGSKFQDFKINVHLSGKGGETVFRDSWNRLSPEAKNMITIENEENTHGLDDCLAIADIVPLVLDVHHHWVRDGEWIGVNDSRIGVVIDSWRGVRPVMHYSQSQESLLGGVVASDEMPDKVSILESGIKKNSLRAHSDNMWNTAVNDWVTQHFDWADIMLECKNKNIAVGLFDVH